ncbi:MAG: lipid-A-disaccharide synthase [Acidobacteriota bacterium]|nr:lipid-A-disaccharide synthase [Acidobacteriota bacterium]
MEPRGGPGRILVSAGEASGDLYAALLVEELRRRWPETEFLGCAGPQLRRAGVQSVIEAENLAVVGLLEVVRHIPRIYRQYRKLLTAARREKPELAILTDSPDFHLRVARRLHQWGIPVVYLVAPQVWAWRKGRLPLMRRTLTRLLCIFPFEEKFFRQHGIPVTYIGHPLTGLVRPASTKPDFFRKHGFSESRPLIAVLPGSRRGEAARHLPHLLSAIERIGKNRPATFVLPASPNTGIAFFRERIGESGIEVIEGEAWDAIAHADLALAASGTVTVEAALLGTPLIAFYRVNPLSWLIGKMLVRVPYFSMVNLIADRKIVPEFMQSQMTGRRIGDEAIALLNDEHGRLRMKRDLAEVAAKLSNGGNTIARAADVIVRMREDGVVQSQAI